MLWFDMLNARAIDRRNIFKNFVSLLFKRLNKIVPLPLNNIGSLCREAKREEAELFPGEYEYLSFEIPTQEN